MGNAEVGQSTAAQVAVATAKPAEIEMGQERHSAALAGLLGTPDDELCAIFLRAQTEVAGEVREGYAQIAGLEETVAHFKSKCEEKDLAYTSLRSLYDSSKLAQTTAAAQLLENTKTLQSQQADFQSHKESFRAAEERVAACKQEVHDKNKELKNANVQLASLYVKQQTLDCEVDQLRTRVSIAEESTKRAVEKVKIKQSECEADAAHHVRSKGESAENFSKLLVNVKRHLTDIEKNDKRQLKLQKMLQNTVLPSNQKDASV